MFPATEHDYVIGLGANLGSRRANLGAALDRIAAIARLVSVSALYESEAWGPPQPAYLNAAVRVRSALAPEALLERLLGVEAELGRVRDVAQRFGPRAIDLDLLWADVARATPALTVPHPRLHERWFALAPLLDVAPELAPLYGEALAAHGGRRAASEAQLSTAPRADLVRSPGALQVRASAPELADAFADALTAVGRGLLGATVSPSSSAAPPACERVAAEAGSPHGLLRDFTERALDSAARGLAFDRATLSRLDPEGCEGRLFGRRQGAAAKPTRLLELTQQSGPDGASVAIRIEVAS